MEHLFPNSAAKKKKIDFPTTNTQRVLCPGALSLKDFQLFHFYITIINYLFTLYNMSVSPS